MYLEHIVRVHQNITYSTSSCMCQIMVVHKVHVQYVLPIHYRNRHTVNYLYNQPIHYTVK